MNDKTFEENVKDILQMSDEKAIENKEQGNFIQVMNRTPTIVTDYVEQANDLPVIIRFDALYLALRQSGVLQGHYHNLGQEMATKLPEFISNPDAIVVMDDGRIALFSRLETTKGKNGIVSIEMNTVKDINSKNDKYNLIVTFFLLKIIIREIPYKIVELR